MDAKEMADLLAASSNTIAAGVGQCIQALLEASTHPGTSPIILTFGNRTMALGRKRMAGMTGRVSLSMQFVGASLMRG